MSFDFDRASGVTANTTNKTPLQQLKHDEQKHALLLFSAGHKLALDKCSFYYYDFLRKGTRSIHTGIDQLPGGLELQEGFDHNLIPIKRLEPWETHKNLGYNICPPMNQITQFEILRDKIDTWSHRVHISPLTYLDSLQAYNAYLEKTVSYVLSPALLNMNDIKRNCDRNVLYAGNQYGALGYTPIYHLQSQAKLQFS